MSDQTTTVTLSDRDRENIEILKRLNLNPEITTLRQAISYALQEVVNQAPKRDVASIRAELEAEKEQAK